MVQQLGYELDGQDLIPSGAKRVKRQPVNRSDDFYGNASKCIESDDLV
jgi:hypothetical protein